jgi:hypothetical protein
MQLHLLVHEIIAWQLNQIMLKLFKIKTLFRIRLINSYLCIQPIES